MSLRPTIPMLHGETVSSFVARVARLQARMDVFQFLNLIEFPRAGIIEPTIAGVERLAQLTGTPAWELNAGACFRLRDRTFRYQNCQFAAGFFPRGRTSYCPACLIEDAYPDSPSNGLRVGRMIWRFAPVRTCPRHQIPLVRRPNVHYAERFQWMDVVAPSGEELGAQLSKLSTRAPSPLQTYVDRRLHGENGPCWLDAQDISQAVRATEMLGAVVAFGRQVNLASLTDADWDYAGAVGFEYTSRGLAGIHACLAEHLRSFQERRSNGGPQAAFGRLYEWLQFNRSKVDPGPIRDVLREFILGNMAVETGARLMGVTVSQRRMHSVSSLAHSSGLHILTLHRALIQSGLASSAGPDHYQGNLTVDAEAGEALAQRIVGSVSISEIPKYLNCNSPQAKGLVKSGLVEQVGLGDGRATGVLKNVTCASLDAFLERFTRVGRKVERASAGMMNLIDASPMVRWPVMDLVALVLENRLHSIELLSPELKFKSVLINPQEAKSKLLAHQKDNVIDAVQVRRRLGLCGISKLATAADRDGRPFLNSITRINSKRKPVRFFEVHEIERFENTYIQLSKITAMCGRSCMVMKAELDARGIDPIMPRNFLGRYVYRRSDL